MGMVRTGLALIAVALFQNISNPRERQENSPPYDRGAGNRPSYDRGPVSRGPDNRPPYERSADCPPDEQRGPVSRGPGSRPPYEQRGPVSRDLDVVLLPAAWTCLSWTRKLTSR